jgi:hypothetical protein
MNLHDGGINHGVFHVRFLRQGIENSLENIGFAPIEKPPERRAQWQGSVVCVRLLGRRTSSCPPHLAE